MLARIAVFFLFVALAGRVLAQDQNQFILTVGKVNMTTADILAIPGPPPALQACQNECGSANSTMQACNQVPSCLCSDATVTALTKCEQCMFTFLITNNAPQTDPRIGSTPILGALSTTCNATNGAVLNKTLIALAPPPTWDGPTGIALPTPALALGVTTAFFFGIGAIVILSSM